MKQPVCYNASSDFELMERRDAPSAQARDGFGPAIKAWQTNSAMETSEAELLVRISRGDQEAFGQFYDRLSGCLFSFAMRILRNETAAEDVLQEVFLQIWERASTYNPELGKPLTWAVTLVRYRAIDRIRANQRGQNLIEAATREFGLATQFAGSADGAMMGRETAERVRGAMAKLPADHRQAIEMAFFGGLSQTEIAAALGAPLGTVKTHIRRGMLQLRDALDADL